MGSTGKDLHVNIPLSKVAMQYRPQGMIADIVAPIVDVPKQSDSYLIWSQADALRIPDTKRAPGTPARKIDRSVSSDTFFCDNYALAMPLVLEDRVNMDAAYVAELRNGRVRYITSKLMLDWENRLVSTLTTGVGSSSTVTSDWIESRTGYSDPIGNCWTAIQNVQDATGYKPNRCVMGELAWRYFRRHSDVISILHGSNGTGRSRYASREQFKDIFELDNFEVGAAYYNSAAEGQAQSLSQLWLDRVLFYYAPPAPSIEEPSFMYSFRWAVPGLPNMIAEVHPFDSKTKSEDVEVGYYQDEKVTGPALGFMLTNVTSV